MDNDESLQPQQDTVLAAAAMPSNDYEGETTSEASAEGVQSHDNLATVNQTADLSSSILKRGSDSISTTTITPKSTTASHLASRATDDAWWQIENENLVLDSVPAELASPPRPTAESKSDLETASTFSSTLARLTRYRKYSENITATAEKSNAEVVEKRTKSESHNDHDHSVRTGAVASRNCSFEHGEKTVVALVALDVEPDEDDDNGDDDDVKAARGGRVERAVGGAREQTLEEFKEELRQKRLARQNAVHDLRDEIVTLRKQLATERALTARLRRGEAVDDAVKLSSSSSGETEPTPTTTFSHTTAKANNNNNNSNTNVSSSDAECADDSDPSSRSRHANIELANAQLALQLANSENISLRAELGVLQKQVGTLKEVVTCCKQMLAMKEEQCNELKGKLTEIENTLGEREMKIMSDNLRQEYERQLLNIRQLRELYDERQRIAAAEHENLQRLISIKRDELSTEQEK